MVVVGIVVAGGWWLIVGRIFGLRKREKTEREREIVRPRGREDEKNKNKKGIKNNKEIIFK